jgi:hypothetical protein
MDTLITIEAYLLLLSRFASKLNYLLKQADTTNIRTHRQIEDRRRNLGSLYTRMQWQLHEYGTSRRIWS